MCTTVSPDCRSLFSLYLDEKTKYTFGLQSTGSPPSAFEVPYNSFREQLDSGEADAADVKTSADKLRQNEIKDLEYDFLCYFLSANRLDLYRSIDFRCEDMLLGKRLMKFL